MEKLRAFSLLATLAGCSIAGLGSIASVSTAMGGELQAPHRHSLLKHPAIEAAIARAKDKLPTPAAMEILSKRHSLVVPLHRSKDTIESVLLVPDSPIPAAVPSPSPQAAFNPAAPVPQP